MIVIDHEIYGEKQEFKNIDEAVVVLRNYGYCVSLKVNSDGFVLNNDGLHVGEKIDA
jgi:hypothetical protein